MNDYDVNQAIEVTKRLGGVKLYRIFRTRRDLLQHFPNIPRKQFKIWIDLESIMIKLEQRKYNTKLDWSRDLSMVWKPLLELSTEFTLLKAITKEFRDFAMKLVTDMPKNENQAKINEINEIINSMELITRPTINQISDT